jgi:hypothetical protein
VYERNPTQIDLKENLMPTRKAPTKSAKKPSPIVALYAVPIHACIRRGDIAEMKKMATQARKHISDVTTALAALDKKIATSPGLKRK